MASVFEEVVAATSAQLRGRPRTIVTVPGYRPSAVAILLVERDGIAQVPFTLRTPHLSTHSGQISLPGGRRDETDATWADCALRELEEELGITSDSVDVLGLLDDVPTPTEYVITPVVARLRLDAGYRPNPSEVAEVFEAPLDLFIDTTKRRSLGAREFRGASYELYAFDYGHHRIWGATARILDQLAGLLRPPTP